eukprot:476182-Pleurochrysis_carterae.AAC.1
MEESYCLRVRVAWESQPCPGQKAWARSTLYSRLPWVGCGGVRPRCDGQRRMSQPYQIARSDSPYMGG